MNRKWVLIGACGLMVLSALYSAWQRNQMVQMQYEHVDAPRSRFAPRQRPIEGSNPARMFGTAIADAVEKVMPTVVVIRTERIELKLKSQGRDQFGFNVRRIVPERLAGEGSGVIIDERGYIITSWHVLDGAQQVEVVLNDGTKMATTYVGHDETSDLAVIKIKTDGDTCPAVEFGNSDTVRVGEVAIAIGSPFSLQSSVTVGHISQKGRRVKALPYEDFIQTDAAINEGNSGGPLIDVDGRLIGINAAIKTDAEDKGVGIAFAVPANLVMVIADSLIEKGYHEWPWVGAYFDSIRPEYQKEYLGGSGVEVKEVFKDTPAARAGLQPGDLVMRVNGVLVREYQDVERVIFHHAVGETISFDVRRGEDEEQLKFELPLEEYPDKIY